MKTKLTILASICVRAILFGVYLTPAAAAPRLQTTPFPSPTPGADGRIIYIAQDGDSPWRIAAIFGFASVDDLYKLNGWEKDHVILKGDPIYLGLAGPALVSPTPGPSPTPTLSVPTATPAPGWGILCVLLYDDLNGDSQRQEDESAVPGSQISVSNRSGTVSITDNSDAANDSECNSDPNTGTQLSTGYVIFKDLPEGDYNVSVAAPVGYNPTTSLNAPVLLKAGDKTYLPFGVQINAKSSSDAQSPVVPETPGEQSPMLGILGGLILLAGVGLGVYAFLLRRAR